MQLATAATSIFKKKTPAQLTPQTQLAQHPCLCGFSSLMCTLSELHTKNRTYECLNKIKDSPLPDNLK